jgi:hypothetical protein
MSAPDDRTPVYLHCRPCAHQWIATWLPMELDTFARLLKQSLCPLCGKRDRVYVGMIPDLLELTIEDRLKES